MQQIINPGFIEGVVKAPPSKSFMQRLCAAALLHNGKTIICNPGESEDDFAAIEIIKKLGAKVNEDSKGCLIIQGNPDLSLRNHLLDDGFVLNCGESGLSLRMFASIAAMTASRFILDGKESLLQRPVVFFEEVFPQLGVKTKSNNGKLPLEIKGPMTISDIKIDGSLSSQFLTGLLFAFSHKTKERVCIEVSNLKSIPYIDLTIDILLKFGYDVINENNKKFVLNPVAKIESVIECNVEGDWSGASFLLVAGAIAGKVEVDGLSIYSKQADRSILTALSMTEANLSVSEDSIKVEKPFGNRRLKPFHFDANDCPDLFPPLAALAANCDGISILEGVNRLLFKESNRGVSIKESFASLGVKIELQDDMMIVHGGNSVTGGQVHSFKDHRIAMACSLLGLTAIEPVKIMDSNVVGKSYPNFFSDLEMIRKK